MELDRVSDGNDDQIHNLVGDVLTGHESQVNLEADLVGVVPNANAEQLNELLVGDTVEVDSQQVLVIVLLAVHFQNLVDLIFIYQESFSEVLCNSGVNLVVNQYFFVVGVGVLPVALRLEFH